MRRHLHRRYGHGRARPGIKIDRIRFSGPHGEFRGAGTRVTFEDGWKMTFFGRLGKGEAIRNAERERAKGAQSE